MSTSETFTVGMMQGRLSEKPGQQLQSFPHAEWKEEFSRASNIGFGALEWLVDDLSESNPILSETCRNEIFRLAYKNQIRVESVCAHAFINGALLEESEKGERYRAFLVHLSVEAGKAGIRQIILPCMEQFSLNNPEKRRRFQQVYQKLSGRLRTEILLETDLAAEELKAFLDGFETKTPGICYDLGNAVALGFNPVYELEMLHPFIQEIHIKDRDCEGGLSRRVGEGHTPFREALETLKRLGWSGLCVFETPVFDNWEKEARNNLSVIQPLITSKIV